MEAQERESPYRRLKVKAFGLTFRGFLVSTRLLRTKQEVSKALKHYKVFLQAIDEKDIFQARDTRFLLKLWLAICKESVADQIKDFLYKEPITQQLAEVNLEYADEKLVHHLAQEVQARIIRLTCPERAEPELQEAFLSLFTKNPLIQNLTIKALSDFSEGQIEPLISLSGQILSSAEALKEKLKEDKLEMSPRRERRIRKELQDIYEYWLNFIYSLSESARIIKK